ncbi:MAG: TetR/AcrR family transcriptional regulator [Planctomycetota bacterium]
MRVFWLKGYDGASLSDLTEAMGINKPSLYACFENKRALFLSAIEHYNETIGGANAQKILAGKTFIETTKAYLAATVDTLTSPSSPPGCLVGAVATDMAGRDEEIRELVAKLVASSEAFLTERFKELGDAPGDEKALAEALVSFGQSLAAKSRVGDTKADLNARSKRFLAILIGPDH